MENNSVIKITGLQAIDENTDTVTTLAQGKHYIKDDNHYLFYDDIDDNGAVTKNKIKFNKTTAEVTKKGAIGSKLLFEKGKNNQSIYSTPVGEILIEVLTKNMEIIEKQNDVDLIIDYELYANNSKVSDSRIEINAKNN